MTPELVDGFAELSGDRNPIHVDPAAAKAMGYARPVAHGALLLAAISRLVGTRLPGSGALWARQSIEWKNAVLIGDVIEITLTATRYSKATRLLEFEVAALNQRGETVLTGAGAAQVPEPVPATSRKAPVAQRVALVTGASRGLGAGIAAHLASLGWAIAVNYSRSSADADALVGQIAAAGGKALAVRADVAETDAVRALVDGVARRMGRIDAVVHCATPALIRKPVKESSFADADAYLRTYLGGAMSLVQAAAPHMAKEEFGRFVFLGSAALFGQPPAGLAPYLAAKGALLAYAMSAATELGPLGITVNVISPGLTVTDLTSGLTPRAKELEARRSPRRRLATVEDTAACVAYLLSDAASYLTGAHLPLTGGPV